MTDRPPPHEADRVFDSNGLRLHARTWQPEAGTVRPPVILHGMDESWRTIAQVAPRLARTRPVFAVDLRGHGGSDIPTGGHSLKEYAADILTLLPRLGGRVDLLGHSLGAMVALLVAREEPSALLR